LQELRQIVARLLDVNARQPLHLVDITADPSIKESRMFLRSAPNAPGRQQMHAHISLRQRVESTQYLGRDGLQARDNQRDVKRAIQVTGLVQLARCQCIVQVTESEPSGFTILILRSTTPLRRGQRLNLRAQTEDLINFR
jgi:hypothetical protein